MTVKHKTYKFRLYPNKEQKNTIHKDIWLCTGYLEYDVS